MLREKKAQSGLAVITTGAVLFIIVLAGLFYFTIPIPGNEQTTNKSLSHFNSYEELVKAFQDAQSNSGRYYQDGVILPMLNQITATSGASKESATDSSGAVNYSKTNIQVEGVDEADIIKNDGKYIYAIADSKLFIVEAYPPQNAKIISKVDLNGAVPNEIFLSQNSNKLVVFATTTNNYPVYYSANETQTKTAKLANSIQAPSAIAMPILKENYWRGYNGTTIMVYNISDKTKPLLEKQIDFEGQYLNSRLIGKYAYFVINSYPTLYTYNQETKQNENTTNIIPKIRVNGTVEDIAQPTQIGIMPRVRPTSFVTIASINLENLEINKETIAGSANNLYASQNNLFLAEQVYEYADYNNPIPMEAGIMIRSIYFPNYNTTEKTTISKFKLENGKIEYNGQGMAPGHLLNQFSMDEHNNNFRIATTVGYAWGEGENASKNNVYIFNSDMNLVGALEALAPGETIYSARFMGNKAYLVTFKKVDPLFVLDLSNPADPKVLGKLKIPGYSDYLHPIDETHIIGVGKEAIESTYGTFAWYQGMKIAIFDVTDVENPKEMHKIVIGDRGTDSEALRDHKAFLYDKEKNLLVIPITLAEIANKEQIDPAKEKSSPTYGEQTFQGAMVFDISLENGIKERGRITHVTAEEELKRGYYYDYKSQVKRSLFMDDVLYTFSEKMLKANNLQTLQEIKEILFAENLNCTEYTYSNCPAQCVARCIPSACSTDGICTDDCDGKNSCTKN